MLDPLTHVETSFDTHKRVLSIDLLIARWYFGNERSGTIVIAWSSKVNHEINPVEKIRDVARDHWDSYRIIAAGLCDSAGARTRTRVKQEIR